MARITTRRRTLELVVRQAADPTQRAREVARIHRRGVAEINDNYRRRLNAVPPSEDIVDGRKGAALESVKLDGGVIVTRWSLLSECLEFVDDMLYMHSPHLTGHYSRNHRLFADGIEVEGGWENAPPAKEYIFVNNVPYARKIERGQSDDAPNGVYEGVATIANARYGHLAWIKFTFRSTTEDYSAVALGGRKAGKKASAEKRAAYNAHNENRYPAIRIYWK